MAITDKLIVYNDALREIGSQPLANLSSANPRLQELNGAFSHAVEYILSRVDWNFVRRRATLTGALDSSHSPYTYRYSRPSDYLRKIWIKTAAADEFNIDHAEIAAVFYGFNPTALIEYISDHADNYDPANWPPAFTRCVVVYLAMLVAPKLARSGEDETKSSYQKLEMVLSDAERIEAVYTNSSQIDTARHPAMRRAIEILGQQLAGSIAVGAQTDQLRWSMNKAWSGVIRYVLEQGAWNFAAKRALFVGGATGDDNIPTDTVAGIVEGYSLGPAGDAEPVPSISGYDYSYPLPDDFLHKIWIKASGHSDAETPHQRLGGYIFTNSDPCIMEYVAESAFAIDPVNWPETFLEVIAARLAFVVAPEIVLEQRGGKTRTTAAGLREKLERLYREALSNAKNKDAIQQYPTQITPGRFVRARSGGYSRLH